MTTRRLTSAEIDVLLRTKQGDWAEVAIRDLVDEVQQHRTAEEKIRSLHDYWKPGGPGTWCNMEDGVWPCDTIKALNGEGQD